MSNDVQTTPRRSTEPVPPGDGRPPTVSEALAGLLKPILVLAVVAALIGAGFWAWTRWIEPEITETTTASYAAPIERIEVTSSSGSVTVAGGGETVQLERTTRFRVSRPIVTEELVDEVLHVNVRCTGELLFSSCSVNYMVTVPESVEVIVDTGSGDLAVRGLSGGITLATGSGSIDVEDVGRDASLQTGSGDIRGSGFDVLALTAVIGSGSIEIEGVASHASLETGSGDIRAVGLTASDLTAITSSGSIDVSGTTTQASLETGSGDIRSDSLSASTLAATTSSGSVDIAMQNAPTSVEVTIGSGDVRLTVPAGAYAFDLNSASGGEEVVGLTQDPAAEGSIVISTGSGYITVSGR